MAVIEPLTVAVRLALVAAGSVTWFVGRRSWFSGTRWITVLIAGFLIGFAACDVLLWWPN